MAAEYEIERAELRRICEIAAESSSPDLRAAVLRAAEQVERVGFGASHIYDGNDTVGCIGVCSWDYGRALRQGKFDGPLYDELMQRHLDTGSAGIAVVIG